MMHNTVDWKLRKFTLTLIWQNVFESNDLLKTLLNSESVVDLTKFLIFRSLHRRAHDFFSHFNL